MAAASATSGAPRITDTTADCGTSGKPQIRANVAACWSTASGRHGCALSTRSAASAAPTAAGAKPVSKMNGLAASMR